MQSVLIKCSIQYQHPDARGGGSSLALVSQNIVKALYLYAGLENGLVHMVE